MANVAMGVSNSLSAQEEADKAFRQLKEASHSQDLVFTGDLNHPNICRRGNRAVQEVTGAGNFLRQVIKEMTRGDIPLDLIHRNKEELVSDVEVRDSLGCSGCGRWSPGS